MDYDNLADCCACCENDGISCKLLLLHQTEVTDDDVISRDNWLMIRRSNRARSALASSESWWSQNTTCEISGWIMDPNLTTEKKGKKGKNLSRSQSRAKQQSISDRQTLATKRKMQNLNAFGFGYLVPSASNIENFKFNFYGEVEAYIKSYRLAKRTLLKLQLRGPETIGEETGQAENPEKTTENQDSSEFDESLAPQQPPEFKDSTLHLHIAKMLQSYLSENISDDRIISGAKQAQSTWYKHLSEEISRLEALQDSNFDGQLLGVGLGMGELSLRRPDPKANVNFRAGFRPYQHPNKSVLKVATCEVFPSINGKPQQQQNVSYDSPRNQERVRSARKPLRPHSARWQGGFGAGNRVSRLQTSDGSNNDIFVGSSNKNRPRSGVRFSSAQAQELQFMRRVSDLMKECERAQAEINIGNRNSNAAGNAVE